MTVNASMHRFQKAVEGDANGHRWVTMHSTDGSSFTVYIDDAEQATRIAEAFVAVVKAIGVAAESEEVA